MYLTLEYLVKHIGMAPIKMIVVQFTQTFPETTINF